MEIGSFLELQLPKGREWYKSDKDIARLNTGRMGYMACIPCDGDASVYGFPFTSVTPFVRPLRRKALKYASIIRIRTLILLILKQEKMMLYWW